MRAEDLVRLLSQSRRRNCRRGITGMLLYKDCHFMQVLEGDERDVLDVFGDIRKDQRHKSVDTLRIEYIQCRNFPNWSMGFVNIDNLDTPSLPGFTRFLESDFSSEFFTENTGEAHAILSTFKGLPLPGIVAGENYD